jgi:hypothetical protein
MPDELGHITDDLVRPGSPQALLRAMKELPRVRPADVDALDAAIASGRLPVRDGDLFEEDSLIEDVPL